MNPSEVINEGTQMMVNNIDEQNLLLDHLTPDMCVLEFGLGFSTILIAQKVKQVVSVEHDLQAYNTFKDRMPENVKVLFAKQNHPITEPGGDGTFEQFNDYVLAPMSHPRNSFDLVFIDGRARVACAKHASEHYVKEGGLIFIHDYRHPQPPPYRRLEYEVVEQFLKMEKHVFAMAMFTVIPEADRNSTVDVQCTETVQKESEWKGTNGYTEPVVFFDTKPPAPLSPADQARAEFENHMIDEVMSMQISELKERGYSQNVPPNNTVAQEATPEKPTTTEPVISPQKELTHDEKTCWYSGSVVNEELNRFYDLHIKSHDITKHMEPFTRLRNCIVADVDHKLLDIGCGTAMLSDWTRDFEYYGTDLPEIIAGCAIRNYPKNFYRPCDVVRDDVLWFKDFDVMVANGFIDVMEFPLDILSKLLSVTKKYFLIHRQEITESGITQSVQRGSYGGYTYHSIINRADLNELLRIYKFRQVAEVPCSFSNWENGGSSFLLVKEK